MSNLNYNKAIIGGRLTKQPELKTTPSGVNVCAFAIATTQRIPGGKNVTLFMDCVAWRKTAEFICNYFNKGSSILVDGELQRREWTEQQGAKHMIIELVVSNAYFVDSKADSRPADVSAQETQEQPNFQELADNDDLPF